MSEILSSDLVVDIMRQQLFFVLLSLWMTLGNGPSMMIRGQESSLPTVHVTAEINRYSARAHAPLLGTLTVEHHPGEEVEISSATMHGKPLELQPLKVVPFPNSTMQLSLYQFEIEGQPVGLYLLPSVAIRVGSHTYHSTPSSYEVFAPTPAEQKLTIRALSRASLLGLQAFAEGPTILYPGQKTALVYQIHFRGKIELTQEDLPLLHPTGLEKIGAIQIAESQEDGIYIQRIKQEVQATVPGVFALPPSHLRGIAYSEQGAQRVYAQEELQATAPGVQLQVLPFPEQDRPTSFQGALGVFQFSVALLSPQPSVANQPLKIALDFTGEGEFSSITLPSLDPLKPFFSIEKLPTIENLPEGGKRFILEITPFSSSVQEIPSLEFAFFDPGQTLYHTVTSQPIPLQILPLAQKDQLGPELQQKPTAITVTSQPSTPLSKEPLPELPSLKLHELQPSKVQDYLLWALPISLLLIFLAALAKARYVAYRSRPRTPNSRQLWREAKQYTPSSAEWAHLVERALLLSLYERKEIASPQVTPTQIPTGGLSGEVRKLLQELEWMRFSGKKGELDPSFHRRLETIFHELQDEKSR